MASSHVTNLHGPSHWDEHNFYKESTWALARRLYVPLVYLSIIYCCLNYCIVLKSRPVDP